MSADRPRDWNGDVRWLLERVAGLRPDQGPGTPASDVVQGSVANSLVHYITGTHTAFDSTGEVTLQLPTTSKVWLCLGFSYNRTSGAGTKITPRVGQAAAFVSGGADERISVQQQKVTAKVNIVFQHPVPFYADAAFRAYFRPGFNSGADNAGAFLFFFQQAQASDESP